MPFRVYKVDPRDRARVEEALGDDIVSRQSIQLRDARHFGDASNALLLFIEGSEAGITRADALILDFAERAPEEAALHAKLKAEEDEAASGLGSVFGEF